MRQHLLAVWIIVGMAWVAASDAFSQHPTMPAGMTHEEHRRQMEREAAMKRRGAAAMGFDQDATAHHFWLTREGGTIEVSVKDRRDEENLKAVQKHLRDIAGEFASGVFARPLATHAEVPPGVAVMHRLQSAIAYAYEDTRDGGRVRIRTVDPEALAAVHDFLRYQIIEHATGDPLTVRQW